MSQASDILIPEPRNIPTLDKDFIFQKWMLGLFRRITTGIKFSVSRGGTAQTVADATDVKMQFNTIEFDSLSAWDSTNYRYVCKNGGTYAITGAAKLSHTITGANTYSVRIEKNGTIVCDGTVSFNSSTDPEIHLNRLINLNVGDYVELYVNQSTGASRDILGSAIHTFFQGYRIN